MLYAWSSREVREQYRGSASQKASVFPRRLLVAGSSWFFAKSRKQPATSSRQRATSNAHLATGNSL
jgi:hypothetical protein